MNEDYDEGDEFARRMWGEIAYHVANAADQAITAWAGGLARPDQKALRRLQKQVRSAIYDAWGIRAAKVAADKQSA